MHEIRKLNLGFRLWTNNFFVSLSLFQTVIKRPSPRFAQKTPVTSLNRYIQSCLVTRKDTGNHSAKKWGLEPMMYLS